MTTPAFDSAIPFILRWEGGFVNNPNDSGGATNMGVTQKVFDDWRDRQQKERQNVSGIEQDEVEAIYEALYWEPAQCPSLQTPLDLIQLDTAVNMGVGRAVRFLQQAVGAQVDGAFGPGTQQCLSNCDQGQAMVAYCDAREAYYRGLVSRNEKLSVFLTGWLNRLNALRKQASLPGYEAVDGDVDYGDAGYMRRVPDIGEDASFEFD